MQVKNTQQGPRGLNTVAGPVLVEAGQTVDVEISAAELASARKSGWFEFGAEVGADDEGEKPALAGLSDEELRTLLAEHGVRADGRWSRERLLTEAEKVQA